jgi:hypothetical protein
VFSLSSGFSNNESWKFFKTETEEEKNK